MNFKSKKVIQVTDINGHIVEHLDLKRQKERYKRFFKHPPTDHGIIQLLDYLSSYRTYKIITVSIPR